MWRARLAARLLADTDDLATSMVDAIERRGGAPELLNRPEFVDQVRRATAGLIQALAVWMAEARPEMADAEIAWSQATGDLAGRNGMPLTDLLTGHRFALARLQELIVAGSADWADSPTEVAEALALTNHFSESLIPQMTAAHTGGARRNAETLEINRLAAVRAVLGGGSFDESRLGLRSGRSHIAIAASGPAAERLGAVLRAEDIGPVLVAAPTPQTRWAWCDGRRLRVETLDRLGCWIGVGQPAVGVGGFITSHQQALLALEVALRSGPAATARYEKVAVQALVWGGQAAADQLVGYALGDLAGRVRRTAKVRETVTEWIECGCSAAKSARRLKLSERTVRNQLERAAILRGRPLTDDLPALATALRLAEHASAGD